MSANTDDFFRLIVLSDQFMPRVKPGEQLIMCRGISAEVGDIVAVGLDDSECPELALYPDALVYYAVTVAIGTKAAIRHKKTD